MPARMSGPMRARSTTRCPAIDARMRSRSSSVPWSVEPFSRNLRLAQASLASWRRDTIPARYAARPKWNALEPSMRVLSRSKKAAPAMPPRLVRVSAPVHFDDHGVALAAARADRRAAEPAAAAAELVHERHQDARAAGPDRVAERDRTAVHVHLRLVHAEHPHRVERDRRERLVDLEQVDVVDRQAGLLERLRRGVRRRLRQVGEVVG